jgi:hypothetical protein
MDSVSKSGHRCTTDQNTAANDEGESKGPRMRDDQDRERTPKKKQVLSQSNKTYDISPRV